MDRRAPADPARMTRSILDIWRDVYYAELGWFTECTEAYFEDAYAQHAHFLVAYDQVGETALGTTRLVLGGDGDLPVERFASLAPWCRPDTPKVELTRLMVRKAWRGKAVGGYPFGVYRGLLRSAFHWCQHQGIRYVVLNVRARGEPQSIIRSLDEYGFIDTGRRIPDEFDRKFPDCTPVLLDLSSFFKRGQGACSPLIAYTISPTAPSDALVHVHTPLPTLQGMRGST